MKISNVPVFAAIRSEDDFNEALKSGCEIIFDLSPDLFSVTKRVKAAHQNKKKLFIHFDLAAGIGKDKQGIRFVKGAGVDGVISTKTNIIKLAREAELFCVQRFFIVDSHSIETTIEAIKISKPDMIEIMPGVLGKVISHLKTKLAVPIIAGGIIETQEEAVQILKEGAAAISTGEKALWRNI